MENLILKQDKKSGHIILNRPDKINSLTHEMIVEIDKKLIQWEKDESVTHILMYGSGTRGFCAGGDMRVYYDNRHRAVEVAKEFFPSEYDMDLRIINYPKPIVAFLDGIVMGGGVGISFGASHKIVTEKTKWAMPEVNIGFFPDVGGTFFMNEIPEEMARYISFLAKFLTGDDVLFLGFADKKVLSADLAEINKEITALESENTFLEIDNIIEKFQQPAQISYLEKNQEKIVKYFSGDSVHEIINKLKDGADSGDMWASETLKEMRKKSLLSQYVIFEQFKRGKELSIEEAFEMEVTLSLNFMDNPDFFEGLRSVLVDKNEADWMYKNPEDISKELVEKFFTKKRPD